MMEGWKEVASESRKMGGLIFETEEEILGELR